MSNRTTQVAVVLASIVLISTVPTASADFGAVTGDNHAATVGNTSTSPNSQLKAADTQIDSCRRITDPGVYTLTQDITDATNETCIRIETSDVIFDGSGHTIDGTTDPTDNDFTNLTVAIKIANSSTPLSNVTVRNVTTTEWSDGISAGPTLAEPSSMMVKNSRIINVTVRRTDAGGIVFANATNTTIANNSLQQTGVGIALFNTSSTAVARNAVNWTYTAFWINQSSTTTLQNNHAINARHGFLAESSRGVQAVNNTANRTYHGIRIERPTGHTDIRNNSIRGSDSIPRHGNSSTGITIINASSTAGASPSFNVTSNNLTGTFTGLGGVINIVAIAESQNQTLQSLHITDNRINHQALVDAPTRGISLYAQGNESQGSYSTIENVTIRNNSILGVPSSGIGVGGSEAVATTLQNITISSNTITRSGAGIVALNSRNRSTTSNVHIFSNHITQTNRDGILITSNGLAHTSGIDIRNNQLTQVKAGIAVAANHNATTQQITARQNTVTESQFGFFIHARDSAQVSAVTTEGGTFRNTTDDGILLLRDPNASAHDLLISAATITDADEAGISAWNSSFDFTVEGTVITNSSEGVLAGETSGNWTIHNTTIADSGVGVDAGRSTGAWAIRKTRIVNSSREGVFADYASGDWTINNSIVHNSTYENIDVDPSSGNWTITNTVLSDSSTGVFAENSTGTWTITNTSITNSTEGVVAENSTGAWTIHDTLLAQHSDTAVDTDFAAGNWTISSTRIVNNDNGVAAVNTTGSWTITHSRFDGNDGAGLYAPGATPAGNASYNYWGEPGGPGGEFDGLGDAVYGNVSISPYYIDAELTTLSSTVRPTLTVNNSDPDTYDSIQAAVDAAPPETTIIVHPGEYNESIQIYRNVSIVSESVYNTDPRPNTGAPAPAPVLDSNGTSYAAFNIHHDITGIRIEGFEVRNYTHGVRAWNNGTAAITIRHNTIGQVGNGVLVGGDPTIDEIGTGQHQNWNIAFNNIRNATDGGMQIDNIVDSTVRSNRVYRSAGASGGSDFSYGIGTIANNETVTNVTVKNNSVTGTYDNFGISVRAGHPLYNSTGTLTDVTIANNRVAGSVPEDGITVSADNDSYTTNVRVRNNTVTDATTDRPGVGVFTVDNGQIGSVAVQNNTLVANEHGFGIGMAAKGSYDTIHLLDNNITRNEQNGVIVGDGTSGDGLIIHENRIVNNDDAGLLHNGTEKVNATRNWWGAADGPSGDFTGSGDEVFGNVTVRPFYTDADLTTLSSEQDDGDGDGGGGDGDGGGDETTTTATTTTTTTTAVTTTTTTTTTESITEGDTETTGSQAPGFGPLAAGTAVLGTALLLLRRRST